jgi:hypothetical protein
MLMVNKKKTSMVLAYSDSGEFQLYVHIFGHSIGLLVEEADIFIDCDSFTVGHDDVLLYEHSARLRYHRHPNVL